MDIFNNPSDYNRYIIMHGLRPDNGASVNPYLLEVKVKKIIRSASDKELEKVAEQHYGAVGYHSADLIREHLMYCAETCGEEVLKSILAVVGEVGRIAGLVKLVKQ